MADTVQSTPLIPSSASTDSAPQVESSTADSSLVTKPFIPGPKPYDDELLEAYEAEATEGQTEEGKPAPKAGEAKKGESDDAGKADAPKEGDAKDGGIEDKELSRTINGKEVSFKIKDAVQAFVKQEEFNRKMDQRITHISQREQRWVKEQDTLKSTLSEVIGVAQKGDFVTAIRALAKLAVGDTGSNVTDFEKQYFAQLDKVRDVYTKMTPEQREAYFAKRALEEKDEQLKRFKDKEERQTQLSSLEKHVQAVQQKHGVPEQEFWGNYKFLADNLVGEGKRFKAANEITAEEVVTYSMQVRHEGKVLEAGQKFGIEDDSTLDLISSVTRSDPSLTVDDIVKIIEQSGVAKNANPKAVENLNRKAGKVGNRFSQASSTKKQNEKTGLDKEDLEFLYRKQPRAYARPVR